MHKKYVFNIISRIIIIVCCFMFLPLGWALHADWHSKEVLAFIETILIGVLLATMFLSFYRLKKDDYIKINYKDGLAIVALTWVIVSFLGALPYYFSGVASFTDAFFESVSGFTTTGASIFTDVEVLPIGILFWRSLTNWLGGMGIMVLCIALLPDVLGRGASQLYTAESGPKTDRFEPRVKQTAKNLWRIYLLFTVVLILLLKLGGMSTFDALCHSFGTIATGGFSTKNASIGAYNSYIQTVIAIFMFLSAANFVLHYQLLIGRPKVIYYDEEFRYFFFGTLVLIAFFSAVLYHAGWKGNIILDSAFSIITITSTSGFATADFDRFPEALRYITILLLFAGACTGSTGGGIRILRIILVTKKVFNSVAQTIYPNAIIPIRLNDKPVSEKVLNSATNYFASYILLAAAATIILCAVEKSDIVSILSGVAACMSNAGPGLGKVGPMVNYGWMTDFGTWLCSILMLAGRLEIYSLFVLLMPETWRK